MFREIRGIEDEAVLAAIKNLPSFYFGGGWADEIGMELFRLPACGEEALRVTVEGNRCRIGFREKIHLFRALGILREKAGKGAFSYGEKMYILHIQNQAVQTHQSHAVHNGFQKFNARHTVA